jgi:anti-sigma regulatory factor (Ser/Thr protein kinase)
MPGSAPQFEQELPRSLDAPSKARRALGIWYAAMLDRGELDRAQLLVSELVSNAVTHGKGRIILRSELDADRLLVEVIDDGEGFERKARTRDFDEFEGWGLKIMDAEASRWGIHEGTTHVWFELERSGPRLGEDAKPAE